MTIQPTDFDLLAGFLQWGVALLTVLAIFAVLSLVAAFGTSGKAGLNLVRSGVLRGLKDFSSISARRVMAISQLTFKEAIRRKALLVFVVFAVLFMFASWFLTSDSHRPGLQMKVYVTFVLTAVSWLVLPVILLLSCWGLPEDIRLRSLHTVVTKPVRRNEVVLGRILGFAAVGTLILSVMSVVGFVWIQRQVSSDTDLTCRVPVYGKLSFLDRVGNPKEKGINVGDIVDTRSFIEGGSNATAIWKFQLPEQPDTLRLESRFEAFRTWKGDMSRTLRVQFTLVNAASKLRVPLRETINVAEFAHNEVTLGTTINYTDSNTGEELTADLYGDIAPDGLLEIHVQCLDRNQYIGASSGDFFIRLTDRSFATGYFKAVVGIWLLIILIVMFGVTASCFVKGPVATLLCFSLIVIGQWFHPFMEKILSGEQLGGGTFESVYRLVRHMNETTDLPEGILTDIIQGIDRILVNCLWLVQHIIPDLSTFKMSPYVASGFDIPWTGAMLPAIAITVGYILPCLFVGYFSLSLRELEAK
ncbi:MAG: hypothetical protein VB858_13395 [Planctomycetaceae bacterium]